MATIIQNSLAEAVTADEAVADIPRKIQTHLVLLLHAHTCTKKLEAAESNQASDDAANKCIIPACQIMRDVLNHMKTCTSKLECTTRHCASSRRILMHWQNCTDLVCQICLPFAKLSIKNSKNLECSASRNMISHYKTCVRASCGDCLQLRRYRQIRCVKARKPMQWQREKMLSHSCRCTDQTCKIPQCLKMRRVIGHTKVCNRKVSSSMVCEEIAAFCAHHAVVCTENDCILTNEQTKRA